MTGRRPFLHYSRYLVGLIGFVLIGCNGNSDGDELQAPKTMRLDSVFAAADQIPVQYTCEGENRSPALSWDAPPTGTESLALIVSDPDAPGKPFIHWVLYDLPPDLRQLPAGLEKQPFLLDGGLQGKNDFNEYGYGGPCPPSGSHRYFFRLYALDTHLNLPPGTTKTDVVEAMQGHVLAGAELMGRYQRQR
ncbi:YbhB/YbcL family Raf kinase inhibitor-like protein [Oculatella sp. LEGE 06141]|uniref:YbhB/YbcL family Raf kinase inhibitor-like protein n=1 Tax=Oculatella sp. LEGE 06141 TaxID=1828648 RepID=UPI001882A89E|nr:YbhB/YbcL family Raf kinase inhibitor-like protein [Oculatella sp. LEGE 06141]MBE9181591.1 YbhB/YbcL family Raf kinase inhibitor-like protein [Oculatella sp. LEGE 06141]